MADVSIKVGGRSYVVGCGEGEEARVLALAGRIDAEAAALGAGGAVPESRFLLMAALMLADKLDEAEAELAARPAAGAVLLDPEEAEAAIGAIEAAAARIEAIASGSDSGDGHDADPGPVAGEPGLGAAERRALRPSRRGGGSDDTGD